MHYKLFLVRKSQRLLKRVSCTNVRYILHLTRDAISIIECLYMQMHLVTPIWHSTIAWMGTVTECMRGFAVQAGAREILQAVLDTGVENVATDRAKYILTWMTVGADQDDFKAPKGEKTFEGSLICNDTTFVLPRAHMMHVMHMQRCSWQTLA